MMRAFVMNRRVLIRSGLRSRKQKSTFTGSLLFVLGYGGNLKLPTPTPRTNEANEIDIMRFIPSILNPPLLLIQCRAGVPGPDDVSKPSRGCPRSLAFGDRGLASR